MKHINIHKVLSIVKKKISSKKTLRILYTILLVFLITLFLILLPYALFATQHILTANTVLYTYLDNASTIKGDPSKIYNLFANCQNRFDIIINKNLKIEKTLTEILSKAQNF